MLIAFFEIDECLESLHTGMKQAIEDLPQEALDWIPGPEINSLSILMTHTAGAERYWIGDVIGRDDSNRMREDEFHVKGISAEKLSNRLDEILAHSRNVLAGLTLEDLEAICTSPRDGRKLTVAWSLAHAIEHTALHLGHMQIIRQLWDQKKLAR